MTKCIAGVIVSLDMPKEHWLQLSWLCKKYGFSPQPTIESRLVMDGVSIVGYEWEIEGKTFMYDLSQKLPRVRLGRFPIKGLDEDFDRIPTVASVRTADISSLDKAPTYSNLDGSVTVETT